MRNMSREMQPHKLALLQLSLIVIVQLILLIIFIKLIPSFDAVAYAFTIC